jgi:hypothetical protein
MQDDNAVACTLLVNEDLAGSQLDVAGMSANGENDTRRRLCTGDIGHQHERYENEAHGYSPSSVRTSLSE